MRPFTQTLFGFCLVMTLDCVAQDAGAATSTTTTAAKVPAAGAGAADAEATEETAPPLEVLWTALPAAKTLGKAGAAQPPDPASAAPAKLVSASLGDSIVIKTSKELAAYLDYAAGQKKLVTLFLDGSDTLITAEDTDRQNDTLVFHLERNGDNKKVWSALMRDPFDKRPRSVDASVGISGGTAVPGGPNAAFHLVVVKWAWYAWAWLALLVLLLIAFVWLVRKYDLLRDGPAPHPYSLGRCQMAWWFFLIIIAYVMIWLISGDQDTIPPSLLALMGISAGTALGAVLIDSSGGDSALSQAATDRLALQAAEQNAKQAVIDAQAAVTAAPADPITQKNLQDAQAALTAVQARLLILNNRLNGIVKVPVSKNLVHDILSDSNGTVGLHRFQVVVWTVVLGIIFMVSVTTELTMPVFSATLLATMGISAGTYLGFKFPEK